MKEIFNNTFIIIIIGFCLAILLIIQHFKGQVNEWQTKYFECSRNETVIDSDLKTQLHYTSLYMSTDLSYVENISLSTIEQRTVKLIDIIHDRKLIFWYDEYHSCQACVNNIIEILKEVSKIIGNEKIILITNYTKPKDIEILKSKFNLEFECYVTKDSWLPELQNQNSFYKQLLFILDKDLQICFSYIPRNSDTLEDLYYQRVVSILKN